MYIKLDKDKIESKFKQYREFSIVCRRDRDIDDITRLGFRYVTGDKLLHEGAQYNIDRYQKCTISFYRDEFNDRKDTDESQWVCRYGLDGSGNCQKKFEIARKGGNKFEF